MAFNNTAQTNPAASILVEIETDPTTAGRAVVFEDNVTGSSSGVIYMIEIDNHLNSSDSYVKFRFSASETSPTSLHAHIILLAPPHEVINYAFPGGVEYTTGLTGWVTTSAALSAGTMPVSVVRVRMLAT